MSLNKITLIISVVACHLTSLTVFGAAPPAGANTCATATSLSGATSSTTCTDLSLSGSTVTGDPLATCNTSAENTSTWYSFVPTSSSYTFMGDNAATSGVSCQHSVAVYSGSCASLTQIGCTYGFDMVSYSGTTFTPGTTYYAQVSYASGGSCGDLDVCAYACPTAPNNTCSGATGISSTAIAEDNFCTTAGPTTNSPTITPAMLCAGSLENTAWYTFTVLNTANVVISITGITCTGGGAGFQIGYFTGACGSLSNIGCSSGSGGTVTATITGLTAGQTVTIAIDGNAGANCTYNISASNTVPLPVELIVFDAKYIEDVVKVFWITASERNNDRFTVERTTDGVNYAFVAELPGAGNSTQTLNYSTIDPSPAPGLSYYRLKQTDFNGKSEYSSVVPVLITDENDVFNVKPNPTLDAAEITYRCQNDSDAKFFVYDYNGRLIMSQDFFCQKGQNTAAINLEGQPDGLYFVTMTANNRLYKTKLIKTTK